MKIIDNSGMFTRRFEERLRKAIPLIAQKSVDVMKARFTSGVDVNGQNFKPRSPDFRQGGAVLTLRGRLRNSIKYVLTANGFDITAGEGLKYARIHNEGGTIRVTAKMKKFFFAKFLKERNKRKKNFWLAMSQKSQINIPKRQFFGLNNSNIKELRNILRLQLLK